MNLKKRLGAAVLTLCMAASLLAVPAGAVDTATANFSDVTDNATAMAVETLRLMNVLDGYSATSFRPGAALTRAQFCKMAVYAMGAGEQVGQYRNVTVYPDVKSSYWAAPYINLAAKGKKIIAGYPDGTFRPESTLTYAQGVTILVRMLGYSDADVGAVWPESYLNQADLSGLTDGVSSTASAPLTRGQAALLFANLLRCAMKDGSKFTAQITTNVVENTVLVTSSADSPDGTKTAMQVAANNAVYPMAYKASNGRLNGTKGTLLLNGQGQVLTFVPDAISDSRTVIVTVASSDANQIVDTTGTVYTVKAGTPVYREGKEEMWSTAHAWVSAGASVTLTLNGGVQYIFVGGGATNGDAVIVYTKGSTAGFGAIAGGSTNYAIYKNGLKASASDMRRYDVATYSGATNSIRVCDTRITGYYEDVSPSSKEPETITVLGHAFPVVPSAADSISKLRLGTQITLLLTEDNQVAGAAEASAVSGSNGAIGIVQSLSTSSATVKLLCGIEVQGSTSLSGGSSNDLQGQLVRVSSSAKGSISLAKLSSGAAALNVQMRTLGSRSLADNVVIYETVNGGLNPITLPELGSNTILSARHVTYAGTDWMGRVNLLVLNNVFSSDYLFGRAIYEPGRTISNDAGTASYRSATLAVESDGKLYGPFEVERAPESDYVAIKLNSLQNGYEDVKPLTELRNVANSAWVGETAVNAVGRTYTVPENVLCYNSTNEKWTTLSAARAFAQVSNLYVDDYLTVRVVEVS